MSKWIEQQRKKAIELVETKKKLSDHKEVNMADIATLNDLLGLSLRDEDSLADIKSLSDAIDVEHDLVEDSIRENVADVDVALEETDDFIDDLKNKLHKFEEMERTTNLVKLDQEKAESKTKIEALNDVKRLLGEEASNDFSELPNTINNEHYDYEKLDSDIEHLDEVDDEIFVDQSFSNKYNDIMYPDSLGGVPRGSPMTRDEANHKRPNPNLHQDPAYQRNCASCVVVYEARLRGYNVQTLPNTKRSAVEKLSYQTNLAWIDPNTGTHPTYILPSSSVYNSDSYVAFLNETVTDNGRYTLQFSYPSHKRRNAGHIISLDKDDHGNLRLYDPQTGRTFSDYEVRLYIDNNVDLSKRSPPKILRVDNQSFNTDMDIFTASSPLYSGNLSASTMRSGGTYGVPDISSVSIISGSVAHGIANPSPFASSLAAALSLVWPPLRGAPRHAVAQAIQASINATATTIPIIAENIAKDYPSADAQLSSIKTEMKISEDASKASKRRSIKAPQSYKKLKELFRRHPNLTLRIDDVGDITFANNQLLFFPLDNREPTTIPLTEDMFNEAMAD